MSYQIVNGNAIRDRRRTLAGLHLPSRGGAGSRGAAVALAPAAPPPERTFTIAPQVYPSDVNWTQIGWGYGPGSKIQFVKDRPIMGYAFRGVSGLGAVFDYSAITDCSMLTAYQQSQAPQCGGSAGGGSTPVVVAPGGANYVAPTNLETPSNCIDPASGLPYFSSNCVESNRQIQARNQAKFDSANRDVFVADCEQAWAANDAIYRALNLSRPVDTCQYKTYGQVPAGGYAGGVTTLLPGAPTGYLDSTPAAFAPAAVSVNSSSSPAGGSGAPASSPSGSSSPAANPTNYVQKASDAAASTLHTIEEATTGIPVWAWAIAGVGAVLAFSGGRR